MYFLHPGFLTTCACPEKQSFPWNFLLYGIYFLLFRIFEQLALALKTELPRNFSLFTFMSFEQLALAWKTKCALNSQYWIYIFYYSRFLSNLRLPWKTQLPWNFSLYWNIFYHSGFLSNLRLPWKKELPWNFHCIKYVFFIIQDIWALALSLKNSCLGIFHCIEIFFYHPGFLDNHSSCPENRVCPEICQALGAAAPPTPASYAYGWKVVHWCRTQASSHNLQGIVDGGVDEAGISTAAEDRGAVLCGWVHQG